MLASKPQSQVSGISPNRNCLHYSKLELEPKGEPWRGPQAVSKVQEPLGALKAGRGPVFQWGIQFAPVFWGKVRGLWGKRLVLEWSEGNVDQRRVVLLGSSLYWLIYRSSKAVICPALWGSTWSIWTPHALKQGANKVSHGTKEGETAETGFFCLLPTFI